MNSIMFVSFREYLLNSRMQQKKSISSFVFSKGKFLKFRLCTKNNYLKKKNVTIPESIRMLMWIYFKYKHIRN